MAGQLLALVQFDKPCVREEERRSERRLAWIKRGTARTQGGVPTAVVLHDLSETGCCLTSEVDYEVGTWLQLRFHGQVMVARVVWNRNGMVGCQFHGEMQKKAVRALTLTAF